MNLDNIKQALASIEKDRNIDKEVLLDTIREAINKAYKNQTDLDSFSLRIEFNSENGVEVYHRYEIVEEIQDIYLLMSLEEAQEIRADAKIGEYIEEPVDLSEFKRKSTMSAKSTVREKLKSEGKRVIYEEYINLLYEMVIGNIESVEEGAVVVNLGKAMAIMPRAKQIPNEIYTEGKKIRVVITECKKEGKGSQLVVSRSDNLLVKRLFEKEVPEIYQGIIEIKAIAREPGVISKVAVVSKNEDVDARGACIGQRGQRVQEIIRELNGERIEIFQWDDDLKELIKNIFAPAVITSMFYDTDEDNKRLVVVVDPEQITTAIGRKGQNVRLATKLIKRRIDIKTYDQLIESGIDYESRIALFDQMLEKEKFERDQKILEEYNKKLELQKEQQAQAKALELENKQEDNLDEFMKEEDEIPPFKKAGKPQKRVDMEIDEELEEKIKEIKKRKENRPKVEYVSKLEDMASNVTKAPVATLEKNRKKKKVEEEERRLRPNELKKEKEYEIKPVYSDEELEEINKKEQYEQENAWEEDDIDYDEFDEYYDNEV